MKNRKQILALILTMLMLLTLAACIGDYFETPGVTDTEIPSTAGTSDETLASREIIPTTEYETENYDDIMRQYVLSLPLQGVTSARVRIRFVADENRFGESAEYIPNELVDISQLAAYYTFIEPGREEQWQSGTKAIFTAETAVSDFQLITLTYGFFLEEPIDGVFVENVIFSLDEFTPELPLVTAWVYEGCFTSGRGISFLYEGVKMYFEIMHSNKSGHLFLREFIPK